jgi:hypothetical protein
MEKVNKKFPQVSFTDMFEIWCKQLNMDFDISKDFNEREIMLEFINTHPESITYDEFLKFSEKVNKKFPKISVDELKNIWIEYKPKVCQHMLIKGKKVNTQCTTKVKGEGDYCYRHQPPKNKEPEAKSEAEPEAKPEAEPEAKPDEARKDSNKKICKHMYSKGSKKNTQCTTIVKREGDYCSKHKRKVA